MKEWMHKRFLFVIPAIVLFGALLDGWPYGYFQILRWVTCASAAFYAFCLYEKKKSIAAYAFGAIAILFNPLAPIYLTRDIWKVVDALTAVFFIGFGVFYSLILSKEDAIHAAHEQTKPNSLLLKFKKPKQEHDLLKEDDEPFAQTLLRLIEAKGMSNADVYKRANIDRRLFSKIRSGKGYTPGKYTIIALAIALELTLKETEDLLKRAGYALSRSQKSDVIIESFIVNKKYDIFEINEVLFHNDLPLLGG